MEGEIKEKLLKEEENRGSEVGVVDEGEGEEQQQQQLKEKVWGEMKKLWIVAGPAIFTRFSTFGIIIISQAFIGHIGSVELAAYALVNTVLLRFANGILVMFRTFYIYIFLHLNIIKSCLVHDPQWPLPSFFSTKYYLFYPSCMLEFMEKNKKIEQARKISCIFGGFVFLF